MALLTTNQSRSLLLLLYPLLSILGFYSVWILLFLNGTYTHILTIPASPPQSDILTSADSKISHPCPHVPIASTVFGIKRVDDFFLGVECMWATMIDGSDAGLSLVAFMFCGIFLGSCSVCWADGLERSGNLRRATIWPFLFTCVGFAPTAPIFYFCKVLQEPSTVAARGQANARHPEILRQWNILPLSIIFGFLLPTYLMVSTSFSGELHQFFTRLWPFFPIYVLLIQETCVLLASLRSFTTEVGSTVHPKVVWLSHNFTWLFGIRIACFFYIPGLAVLLLAKFTPGMFKEEVLESISWTRLYTRPSLWGGKEVGSLQEGMLCLMLWDGFVGGSSGVLYALWKVAVARKVKGLEEGGLVADVWRTGIITAFLGSGSGAMSLMMDRDELMLEQKVDIKNVKAD